MNEATSQHPPQLARSLTNLRTNAFAAMTMLIIEYALGVSVNLYATIPLADHGTSLVSALVASIVHGPVTLAVHAILGTLLIITGLIACIRASRTRRWSLIIMTAIPFIAIILAWLAGTSFVGHGGAEGSLAMALDTGVALFCYSLLLFVTGGSLSA